MRRSFLLGCAFLATASFAAAGVIADLNSDFSTITNAPNGWSYNSGTSKLIYVPIWAGYYPTYTQGAWVPDDGGSTNTAGSFLPALMQANQTYDADFQLGDIGMHSFDDYNGDSNGTANVTWTSTYTGVVDISGTIWETFASRNNNYNLLLNSASLTSGTVVAGVNNRAAPVSFSFIESITTGEVLEMDILPSSPGALGSIAGMTLDISTATPEPACLLFGAFGMGVLGFKRFLRRR